ncbi:NADPH dependent diflavin oxidoreductase 1 [Meredithblackwellia eburnea MCA 4105]
MDDVPLPLESRSLLVLHASVTGTSIDVAERIGRIGRREGWAVDVKGVAEFDQSELLSSQLIVFVLPTTGNGAPPPSFVPLWTALLHPALPPDFLEDLRYAVFGLGDSSYAKYNWVAKKMSRRLDLLGATSVIERGEGDDQNEWGIESTFPDWVSSFYEAIDPLFPVSPNFVRLSPDDIPPPRARLDPVITNGVSPTVENKQRDPRLWARDVRWAKVIRMERVTPDEWFQDVRTVVLELPEGMSCTAGDILEILPENSVEDVEKFLTAAGWGEFADTPYTLTATNPYQPLPPSLPSSSTTTLRSLLTKTLDISRVPLLSFFEFLSHFTSDVMQEKLRYFCTGEGQDDLNDYTLRPKRTIGEVMWEFRSAIVPKEFCLDLLPTLRPRGFSIAGCGGSEGGPERNTAELLVAIVKYRTMMSVPRKGVCTTYISKLQPGDLVPVRIDGSGLLRLPTVNEEGKQRPLIMVGPGTGVAPFRALMMERKRAGAKENLLFFGCRSSSNDYYYQQEWTELVNEGILELSLAPSRDQEEKVYVQHKIPLYGKKIWEYLNRDGLLFVCGSSTQMPKSVKKAFLSVFRSEGSLDEAGAEAFWDRLEREGRLVEETWG